MKCRNCGKELVKVGELTEEESANISYINTLINTTNQALSPLTIKDMEFDEGELFEYFMSVFESKAKAEFLRYMFFQGLGKRLGINEPTELSLGETNIDIVEVYVHPKN